MGEPQGTDQPMPAAGPFAGLSTEDLITLNEEIAGMARAGLPLDQGLAALAGEMGRGRLRQVTAEIADSLRAGLTLPQAMQQQGHRVPPYYAGLVAAGIRTGRLNEVLATLTIYARTMADLRSMVLGALFYPAVVLVLGCFVFGFVTYFIIPQFVQIFADFKLKLPLVTELVFAMARHPLEVFVIPLAVILLGIVLGKVLFRYSLRSRRVWARIVYSLPIVGAMVRSARLASFADLLGMLVDHEVPLPEAIYLAGAASSDPLLSQAAPRVGQDLSQGSTLADLARSQGLVPELMAWMMGLGEQRGTLGKTLHHLAQMYRRQVEMRASLLRSTLPSFFIIVVGASLLGLFVLAIFLPMLRLLEGLGGGLSGGKN